MDEKYFLSEEQTLDTGTGGGRGHYTIQPKIEVVGNVGATNHGALNVHNVNGISPTLNSRDYKGPKLIIDDQGRLSKQLTPTDIVPTLRAQSHGNEPKVIEGIPIKEATTKVYTLATEGDSVNLQFPDSATNQGVVEKSDALYVDGISENQSFAKKRSQEILDELGYLPNMYNPYNKQEITDTAPTQTTLCDRATGSSTVLIKQPQYRIRKLTPLECWRLQGFPDWAFRKAEQVNSNSQLYKQAGNSVTVNVISAIAAELTKG